MENQNPRVPPLWEHSLTTLLGHDPTGDPGIALRQWVHFQECQISPIQQAKLIAQQCFGTG